MRYGNIIYNKRNGRLNLGDDIQLLAIEHMYEQMGIDYSTVVRIELSDLYNWTGEEVVVPISFPIIGYNNQLNITCFSDKIHPVFLALSILAETLTSADVEYLNRYSPIGCRDYHTYSVMQKYNIPSYLFGCMTLTMPKVWKAIGDKDKVFCVDISDKLKKYIPTDIQSECIYLTNAYNAGELDISPEDKAREMYDMLTHKAKLVITSRMHVALPCIAAGVPVIFAKDLYSYRFAGIDRVVRVYDEGQYEDIEWQPEPAEYEDVKRVMLELAKSRVEKAFAEYSIVKDYEEMLGKEPKRYGVIESVRNTESYLKMKYGFEEHFSYAIWSVTQTGNIINEMVKSKWKNAKLVAVIDRAKTVEFDGVMSERKDKLLEHKEATILVCSDAAIKEASEFFSDNGMNNYYYCCQNGMEIKKN